MRRLQKPTTCCSNVNYVVISLKAYVSVAVLFEMEFLFGNHYLLGVVVAAITVIVSNYSSCGAFWCPLKLYFLWFLFAQFRYVALFFLFPFTFSFFCSFGIRKRFFGVWFRFSAVIHTHTHKYAFTRSAQCTYHRMWRFVMWITFYNFWALYLLFLFFFWCVAFFFLFFSSSSVSRSVTSHSLDEMKRLQLLSTAIRYINSIIIIIIAT